MTAADEGQDRTAGDAAGPGAQASATTGRPARSTGTGLFATLKRTFTEFSEDNLSDWAAALTYYGLLSLFPALIALVGLLGLVGNPHSTTQTITQIVTKIGPSSAAQTFSGPIQSITSHKSTAGILGIVGIAAALWSASGYVGAFMRASNIIYETPEGRPIWKLRPLQLLVTLVMLLLLASWPWRWCSPGRSSSAVAGPLGVERQRGQRLEHRQVAGAADRRDRDVLGAVLRRAEREAAPASSGSRRDRCSRSWCG